MRKLLFLVISAQESFFFLQYEKSILDIDYKNKYKCKSVPFCDQFITVLYIHLKKQNKT